MPLGLACVAQATKNAVHVVSLLDLMFEMDAASVLKKTIAEFRPECIGISVRNIDDQNIESPRFFVPLPRVRRKYTEALCEVHQTVRFAHWYCFAAAPQGVRLAGARRQAVRGTSTEHAFLPPTR